MEITFQNNIGAEMKGIHTIENNYEGGKLNGENHQKYRNEKAKTN